MFMFPNPVRQLLLQSQRVATKIRISDEEGHELLRTILIACTELRLAVDHVRLDREVRTIETCEQVQDAADNEAVELERQFGMGIVTPCMPVEGKRAISHLMNKLTDVDGIREVGTRNEDTGLNWGTRPGCS